MSDTSHAATQAAALVCAGTVRENGTMDMQTGPIVLLGTGAHVHEDAEHMGLRLGDVHVHL